MCVYMSHKDIRSCSSVTLVCICRTGLGQERWETSALFRFLLHEVHKQLRTSKSWCGDAWLNPIAYKRRFCLPVWWNRTDKEASGTQTKPESVLISRCPADAVRYIKSGASFVSLLSFLKDRVFNKTNNLNNQVVYFLLGLSVFVASPWVSLCLSMRLSHALSSFESLSVCVSVCLSLSLQETTRE